MKKALAGSVLLVALVAVSARAQVGVRRIGRRSPPLP